MTLSKCKHCCSQLFVKAEPTLRAHIVYSVLTPCRVTALNVGQFHQNGDKMVAKTNIFWFVAKSSAERNGDRSTVTKVEELIKTIKHRTVRRSKKKKLMKKKERKRSGIRQINKSSSSSFLSSSSPRCFIHFVLKNKKTMKLSNKFNAIQLNYTLRSVSKCVQVSTWWKTGAQTDWIMFRQFQEERAPTPSNSE